MSANAYSLKYRTFDQLFEDVSVDFKNYTQQGMIDPATLIKIARKCNYDLGFRIYRTRQTVLEVEHGKVRLPDDFHILNFATVCGEYTVTEAQPQGTWIEERLVAPDYVCEPGQPTVCGETPDPCTDTTDPCDILDPCSGTCLTRCGDEYQLIQKINTVTRTYKQMFPLYITNGDKVECDCINTKWDAALNQAHIEYGFLKTNFDNGKVYINYMGDMIDDNGSLLVPDHEFLNEYYEYALKKKILEDLAMNDEVVDGKLKYIKEELRQARNNALSIVNTPNFSELKKMWQINRKAQYHNYYNMFKSHWPLSYK